MVRQIIQVSIAALILATTLYAGAALAHGKVAIEEDSCMRRIGENMIHFSAYQPQNDIGGHYCTDIPHAGDTVLVVDLIDPALRDMPIGMKVIKGNNATDGETIINIQPGYFKDGVINTESTLEQGEHVVIVTAEGVPPLNYQYQLRVEMINYAAVFRAAIGPVIGLLLMIVLGYKLVKSKRLKSWLASRHSKINEQSGD
ncbi:hypothetical protein SAMN05216419_10682 [Nitrosomonas cryotolerans]|uniref:Uncharacterized protein n=1 Tax=Nitrosomonas cryotolerans ATCC 49181 TaxID=1131553 RepID=A0A1N6H0R9_9PROT|nr:hypothetical protein [Nitrosomonas cryotolerans]SFQ12348.1 hypothetical protein SAMN05216419_10682 [Nitrosomonas cryotolerans]SIO13277.1 hypothetical protein SAMN02743940_0958 [Nitrosomonas cryotolerans ATCC 49181]